MHGQQNIKIIFFGSETLHLPSLLTFAIIALHRTRGTLNPTEITHEIQFKPHRKHIASTVRRPIGLWGLGKVRVSYVFTKRNVQWWPFFFLGVRRLHPLMIKIPDASEKRSAAILKVPGSVQGIQNNAEEANVSVQRTQVLSKTV